MKMLSLFAVITDSIFAAACSLFIFFTAIRFYTGNVPLALFFGIVAALVLGALCFLRLKAKRGRAISLGQSEGKRSNFKLYLCTLDKSGRMDILKKAYGGEIKDGALVSGDRIYVAEFTPLPLSSNDICRATAFASTLEKVVVCNSLSDEAKAVADRLDVRVAVADGLYEELEKKGELPESYPFKTGKKKNFMCMLKGAVKKSYALRWMMCGLWLTAFSYFTFFPVYYIVAGGVMLAFSAVCLLFGS